MARRTFGSPEKLAVFLIYRFAKVLFFIILKQELQYENLFTLAKAINRLHFLGNDY